MSLHQPFEALLKATSMEGVVLWANDPRHRRYYLRLGLQASEEAATQWAPGEAAPTRGVVFKAWLASWWKEGEWSASDLARVLGLTPQAVYRYLPQATKGRRRGGRPRLVRKWGQWWEVTEWKERVRVLTEQEPEAGLEHESTPVEEKTWASKGDELLDLLKEGGK